MYGGSRTDHKESSPVDTCHAKFPGGGDAWRSFLEQNLNVNVAADDGVKPGIYSVKVQFIVDTAGAIHNVHAIDAPKSCPSCIAEAVRIIRKAPL